MDLIKALEDKVSEITAKVELAVEIKMIREATRWHISRLLTLDLDPKHQADYHAALTALNGEQNG
jgi:hypothetical protein